MRPSAASRWSRARALGVAQLAAHLLEPLAVVVQTVDEAIEFSQASRGQRWCSLAAIGLGKLGLEPLHLPAAAREDSAQPKGRGEHEREQRAQANAQTLLSIEQPERGAGHRPRGEIGVRRSERTGRDNERLARRAHDVGLAFLRARGDARDLGDVGLLRIGHVTLYAAAFVGRIRVRDEAAVPAPDATFDMRLLDQHELQQHLQQIELRGVALRVGE
jgi:hypothetical protein